MTRSHIHTYIARFEYWISSCDARPPFSPNACQCVVGSRLALPWLAIERQCSELTAVLFQLDSFANTHTERLSLKHTHSILFSFFIICFECICYIFHSTPLSCYHFSLSMAGICYTSLKNANYMHIVCAFFAARCTSFRQCTIFWFSLFKTAEDMRLNSKNVYDVRICSI